MLFVFLFKLCLVCVKLSRNIKRHCLDSFLKRFGKNIPEALKILSLVLKIRAKLRIVDKSMLMYNEHGVFISITLALSFGSAVQSKTSWTESR